jgi:hypothetical protein
VSSNRGEPALRPAAIQQKATNGHQAMRSAKGEADSSTVADTFKTILQIVAV